MQSNRAARSAESFAAFPQTRRELFYLVSATSLVNGLEVFNFTVFGFFAVSIGQQFFPAADPMTSLLLAVSTFGVGFFMRPFGAMAIGAYADRIGRRAAMTVTIWLTALGTAALAFCPPFASIGVAAPLVLVVARALQGFAAGGELGAATTFVMEAGPLSRRGYLVSWLLASQGAAALLGACLGMVLGLLLSATHMAAWGWRIPFLLGLLIVPLGFYVQRRLRDDTRPAQAGAGMAGPLGELAREHGWTMTLAVLMIMGRTVPVYAIVFFMPSYLSRVMHMPSVTGFLASALSALLLFGIAPLSGWLADHLPRRKPLVLVSSGGTALLVYPVFLLITHEHNLWAFLLGVSVVSILVALNAAVGTLLIIEAFPARVRASGLAISYAISVTLFGGTAQMISTALLKWTGNPMSAAAYVALACLVSFGAVVMFEEKPAAESIAPTRRPA